MYCRLLRHRLGCEEGKFNTVMKGNRYKALDGNVVLSVCDSSIATRQPNLDQITNLVILFYFILFYLIYIILYYIILFHYILLYYLQMHTFEDVTIHQLLRGDTLDRICVQQRC